MLVLPNNKELKEGKVTNKDPPLVTPHTVKDLTKGTYPQSPNKQVASKSPSNKAPHREDPKVTTKVATQLP